MTTRYFNMIWRLREVPPRYSREIEIEIEVLFKSNFRVIQSKSVYGFIDSFQLPNAKDLHFQMDGASHKERYPISR
jgi:hypothetical protein